MDNNKAEEVARLNDDFRHHLAKGTLVLTRGIRCNTKENIAEIIARVRNFNNFNEDNDPYGERDFGAFDYKGQKIFWKIDYYDREFLYLSSDVSSPRLTNRVMTIMYAEEY